MRRLLANSAVALLLAVPLWAQHGGGHAGGGGFAGGHFSGGAHAAASASRGFAGASSYSSPRSSSSFSRSFSPRGFSSRGFSSHGVAGHGFSQQPFLHDGFHGYGFRGRTFLRNCFGYGCWGYAYPWAYAGYYDPYWWGSDSSYDDDYERDRAVANEMNQQNLEEQQMLRQEDADGDRDLYARSSRAPRPASGNEQQGTAIMPATVLVFRDQHTKEIQNYAIVGQTVWSFAPQHTEKIPLSEIDVAATSKANDERGVTFRVPTSNEAQ